MLLATLAMGVHRIHTQDTLATLVIWNIIVFLVFVVVHRFYGLKHVELPDGEKPTWGKALYFATITHCSFTPPGEFTPRDTSARAIVASHAFLAWVSLFWTIFSFTEMPS